MDRSLQGSSLGDLLLQEFAAEKTEEDPLLCLSLGNAVLESPCGGPMEVSLLPLELFNDAARFLRGIQASHCLPRLTEQANQCLDELLALLAQKVGTDCAAKKASIKSDSCLGFCDAG